CAAWAEKNKQIVAIAILDWGGNLIESHAMEGAPANAIDTALLKAKSALRWRRPTSETNKMVRTGENLAPTFMNDFPQPGALPLMIDGQLIGAMGVSGADGEKCAQAAIDAVLKGQTKSNCRCVLTHWPHGRCFPPLSIGQALTVARLMPVRGEYPSRGEPMTVLSALRDRPHQSRRQFPECSAGCPRHPALFC